MTVAEGAPRAQASAPRVARRRLLAAAGVAAAGLSARAQTPPLRETLLETRLFNFRDDLPADIAATTAARLRAIAASAGADGILIGRNLNATPFPTRFEWVFTMGRPARALSTAGARESARALTETLAPVCAAVVGCELASNLPAGFAAAPGVKVRHTVMFDFTPAATPDARRRIVGAIRAMGRLPMVKSYIVAPNPAFGTDPAQMEWQVIGDFAGLADYKAYSDAPAHLGLRDDFRANTARVAFIDVNV